MHIFVDAARNTLQRLWDELFFSEDQMADFAPAFTGISLQQVEWKLIVIRYFYRCISCSSRI